MQVEYGRPEWIDSWMVLVRDVRANFPGLETEEALTDHRNTVLRMMENHRALCIRDGADVAAVLLFSQTHSMIACMAVSPHFRRRGAGSLLLAEALRHLDRTREISVTTFREGDPLGDAPRALYRKFGFREGELVTELDYPCQIFVLPKENLHES